MECSVCKIDKEENNFQTYWHSSQNKMRTRKQCTKCFYENRMKNNNPDKYYENNPDYKKCHSCNEWKLIATDYYTTKTGKIYIIRCKDCEQKGVREDRQKYLRENCGSDQVLRKPNTYTDEYQKECTFTLMGQLGYQYDEITGIWTKDTWKEIKDGKPYFPKIVKFKKPIKRIKPEMVIKMIELREEGYSLQMIAENLGTSNTSVFVHLNKHYGKIS